MRWNLLLRSALGLSVIAGLLGGLLVDSASAQARRGDRNRIVDSTGADVSSLNGARGVPLEAARGPQVQRDYAGSLDARLMQAAIGVDPYSLVAAGLGHGNPTGEKFTSFATMRKLPSIEEVRRGKKRRDNRETVCGTDQRTRVTNTTAAPFRWTCELVITLEDGSQAIGTGWFVGPRCVVTAGHCVHGGGTGESWVRRIEVIPGMNGSARPFGTVASTRFLATEGWVDEGDWQHDFAAIILPTPLGDRTGWFGYGNYTDSVLRSSALNSVGYPGDKPFGTMWATNGPVASLNANQIFYMFDTFGGQSGSAVWRTVNGVRYVVGIHAYGGCPNSATRINGRVFNFITSSRRL